MSSGSQVDLDWAGMDAGANGLPGAASAAENSASAIARMSDEEILGISPSETDANPGGEVDAGAMAVGARHAVPLRSTESSAAPVMPAWMQAVAADPKHAGEATQLWQEHQAFRAAFSSAEEARAMKEMLPGGAQEVQALRQMAAEVDSLRAVAAE